MTNKRQRILCIDLGDVRTGIAVSDELGLLAHGIITVKATGMRALCEIVNGYADEYGANIVVVGNPINMNGTIGERSDKATKFAERLKACGLNAVMFDERCTTMAAHRIMNETDTRGKKRKAAVDTLSAQIILQNYLDATRDENTES